MDYAKPVRELIGGAAAEIANRAALATRGRAHRRETFTLNGRRYSYHAGLYNMTWQNERTVEIPIITEAVAARKGARTLEVGNVLAHYGVAGHTVVDKYERAPGVVNADILDFTDPEGFDLIVSISTLEHVGFEEEVPEPAKPARVLSHLKSLLASGGEAIITFPLGYNPSLDNLVRSEPQLFGQMSFLARTSNANAWTEVDAEAVSSARYGSPYPSANALVIATIAAGNAS